MDPSYPDRKDSPLSGILNKSADDDGSAHTVPPSKLNSKRRAQDAAFDAWMKSDAGKQALAPKKQSHGQGFVGEPQSLGAISAQLGRGTQIIRSPRDYQIELFERAKQGNTIAVLDTGTGKTLIAILLLRWILDNELETKPLGKQPKIAFFLVPAVNLVFQQHAVLERNLDYKISRLCGADGVDCWRKELWDDLFRKHQAVVCTPDILHICLSQGFININRINLIIFDEAHHAKGNHAYTKIMKEFYRAEPDISNRPRVFGMTASPVDGKHEVVRMTQVLEHTLDSRIATTSTMGLSGVIKKPQESRVMYTPPLDFEPQSQLLRDFGDRYKHVKSFAKPLQNARDLYKSLGPWFADTYMLNTLSNEHQTKYELDIHKRHNSRKTPLVSQTLEHALEEVHEALTSITMRSTETPDPFHVTPKVLKLKSLLSSRFQQRADYRCIVFVEQRATASLLHEYFDANQDFPIVNMRSGYLIGSGSGELDELHLSHHRQMVTLMQFRKGDINCLFATQVAEEGLDVPDCNLIVRFDLCRTMIQYVQSRGRARNQQSEFIHMVEAGNTKHESLISEAYLHENAMRKFCEALPADRYLTATNVLLHSHTTLPQFTEPLTAAKLNYGNSMGFLANFVSTIPSATMEPQHPEYEITAAGLGFTARIILPEGCPISEVTGDSQRSHILAKQSAAFEACVKLRLDNYIDEHFRSTVRKELPAMRNSHLAVNPNKKTQYVNRVKPSAWTDGRGMLPTELWTTAIDFAEGIDRPHQPLILLTRTPMPQFPPFPVFLNDSRMVTVRSTSRGSPLAVSADQVDMLGLFTWQVFRDVFSKTYEKETRKWSYWLAPAHTTVASQDPLYAIDWPLLAQLCDQVDWRWTPDTPKRNLIDRFIFDLFDGGRKFYSVSINETLAPTDPVPDDADNPRRVDCILDYSNSLWKNSRHKIAFSLDQPVIEAARLTMRRNVLAAPSPIEIKQNAKAFVCPEPLRISALPPDVVATAFLFPGIIHRYESYLIAIEGCRAVDIDCQLNLALAAFTKDSDNSGDWHAAERINFQDGMGENYERLEFIGDTFLKLTTSLATFINSPIANEFESHVQRMLMLCNKNLFRVALDLKIYEYIRCAAFSRRLWYPEGIVMVKGKGIKANDEDFMHDIQQHPLGDKTIADVSEALIGAAFVTDDTIGEWQPHQWDQAVRTVSKLVDNDDHRMSVWGDYSKAYIKPAYQTAPATATQQYLAERVEEHNNYHFRHPRLLFSAFLHPSYTLMADGIPTYQRLEFLGDALLDVAAVRHLFYRHPHADPQWLTEHKMAMVSNKFLGTLCVLLGFHTHLRHTLPPLQAAIAAYVTEIHDARARNPPERRDFWLDVVPDPPKCLPDVVEAYVAAMFIDADFDYAPVQRFFDEHVRWFFEDMSLYDSYANNHPMRRLEAELTVRFECRDWLVMVKEVAAEGEGGDDDSETEKGVATTDVAVVMVHDRVVAASSGKSARYARGRVAGMAAKGLEGLERGEFRRMYGCTCGSGVGEGNGEPADGVLNVDEEPGEDADE